MAKVLVVDDTAVDRRIAGGLLEKNSELEIQYAAHGAEALERMQESCPDVVVTDLQMPEIDGLELVTRVRMQYPNVPVILITAKGSETLAVEALEQGASSYVPKSQLADKLLDTVEEVLSLATADRTYARLMQCQKRIEFNYELDNDGALVDALVDLVQQMVYGMGLTDHTGKFRIGVAVREALLNALYRGNLEISFDQMQESREHLMRGQPMDLVEQRRSQSPYCDRRIFVDAQITSSEAQFVIRDEGPGFEHTSTECGGDLSTVGSLDAKQGRGLVLMRSFMDEVTFNESGNQVTMLKRCDVS